MLENNRWNKNLFTANETIICFPVNAVVACNTFGRPRPTQFGIGSTSSGAGPAIPVGAGQSNGGGLIATTSAGNRVETKLQKLSSARTPLLEEDDRESNV